MGKTEILRVLCGVTAGVILGSMAVGLWGVVPVKAATIVWDGGGTDGTCGGVAGDGNKWSCGDNWSTNTVPTSSDVAAFNATSAKAATVDSGFGGTVGGVNITSAYTGTVTLATGLSVGGQFALGGGTFDSNTQTLDVDGLFSISGGAFTSSSGTMTLDAGVSISGGTFAANSGTVALTGGTTTLACGGVTFNLVTIASSGTKTVGSDCSLPLGANPTVSGNITLNGTLSGSGSLTASTSTLTINSTGVLSGFSGLVAGSLTIAGASLDVSAYTTVDINSAFTLSSGSFTAPAAMTVAGNFSVVGGTFSHNSGTVTFDGTAATLGCNDIQFYLVEITAAAVGNTKTVGSDCSLPLGDEPTFVGTIDLAGTLSGTGALTGGAGNLTLSAGATVTGFTEIWVTNLTVSGATISLGDVEVVDVGGNFTLSSGTLTAPASSMNVAGNFSHSGGTFNHNSGSVILDGAGQALSGSSTFYNLSKSVAAAATLQFPASETQTVEGVLTLRGVSGGALTLVSSATGTYWNIDPSGSRDIDYVTVRDSNNTNAAAITVEVSTNTNVAHNNNWVFTDLTPSTGGATYYVATNGSNGNDGSLASPWATVAYGISQLVAGDTLNIRAGSYYESNITITADGTAEDPITIQAYAGESVEINGGAATYLAAPNSAWTPVGGTNMYRSTATYSSPLVVAGWLTQSAVQLIQYLDQDNLDSTNYAKDADNPFANMYFGPGIFYDSGTGYVYIRLDANPNDLFDADGNAIAHIISDTDPRNNAISISTAKKLFSLNGASYITFKDLHLHYADIVIETLNGTNNVTVDNVFFRYSANGILSREGSAFTIKNSNFSNGFPPFLYWTDVKNGNVQEVNEGTNFQTFAFNGELQDSLVELNYFHDAMDAILVAPGSTDFTIRNNVFNNTSDDAINLNRDNGNVEVNNNIFWATSIGLSILGPQDGTTAASQGHVYIHHNIFDTSKRNRMGRPENYRADAYPQWTYGNPVSSHGGGSKDGWWKMYNNTVIGNEGRQTTSTLGPAPALTANSEEYVVNNVFYAVGDRSILGHDLTSSGATYDGNVVWRTTSGTNAFFQDFGNGSDYTSLLGFRNSSGTTWEATGLEIDPGFDDSLVNLDYYDGDVWGRYTPSNAVVNSLGYSYAGKNWPGTAGVNYRGAMPAPVAAAASDTAAAPQCTDTTPVGVPVLYQIDTTTTTAALYFTPVNSGIIDYRVTYDYKEGADRFGVIFRAYPSSGALRYEIGALTPATTYYFKVVAGNGCTVGGFSGVVAATTKFGQSGGGGGLSSGGGGENEEDEAAEVVSPTPESTRMPIPSPKPRILPSPTPRPQAGVSAFGGRWVFGGAAVLGIAALLGMAFWRRRSS